MPEANVCFNCDDAIKDCSCGGTKGHSHYEIICPYCGYGNHPGDSDGLAYDESTTEYDCGKCEKEFPVNICVSYLWTTRRD